MSSLAASRADNFYNPPDWDPSKISRDKYQGSKGSNQYEQKGEIRFEMPWNIWCIKCNSHIGRGVRYNAKKIHSGYYFSTKIWQFNMKCHICKNVIKIQTDPQNCDYKVIDETARRQWNNNNDNDDDNDEIIEIKNAAHKERMQNDPIYKLQHEKQDKLKQKRDVLRLYHLHEIQERDKNDYDNNCLLRKKFRQKKKKKQKLINHAMKKGLNLDLLEFTDDDIEKSKNVEFKNKLNTESILIKQSNIGKESIFKKNKNKNKRKRKEITKTNCSSLHPRKKHRLSTTSKSTLHNQKISKKQKKLLLLQKMKNSHSNRNKSNIPFSVDLQNISFTKKK